MSLAGEKGISILTETQINHDQIHHIRNNWLVPIISCSGDIHTKGLLVQLHLGLQVSLRLTLIQKRGLCPFKFTPSNDRVLCGNIPSEYSSRKQLARRRFFKGLQNYMENKNDGNENKIILGDFNCTMDKKNRDGENKTQRLYRCCSNYGLSKLIVDNRLEDLWRRENPDFPEFTC